MSDYIQQFIDAMRAAGCGPAHPTILADNKFHDYQIDTDPPNKKKGYYILDIIDGFPRGGFGDRRRDFHAFKPRMNRAWSEDEKKEWRKKAEAAQKKQDQEMAAIHAEAAGKAAQRWEHGIVANDHVYLERKKIQAHGAKIDNHGNLLIPMVSDDKLFGIQSITLEGDKYFMRGARKKGCYYPLTSANENMDTIIICEGFATGATIREELLLPVIVAFDAGNLKSVAISFKAKYPFSLIVIACDNDKAGIKYGTEAAEAVKGQTVWPSVEDKDFNDSPEETTRILEALRPEKASGGTQLDEHVPAGDLIVGLHSGVHVADTDTVGHVPVFDSAKFNGFLRWKSYPSETKTGRLEPNSLANILVFLRHHPEYNGLFRFDKFSRRTLVYNCPHWEDEEKFVVRKISDTDYNYLEEKFERLGLAPSPNKIIAAIDMVARENWIHPILDYFEKIKWDGQSRLCSWLRLRLDAKEQSPEWLSAVGTMFFISAVARQYQPGCKAENMMVLEGPQGMGKSTALAVIANLPTGRHHEDIYFCDTLTFSQIQEKDAVLKLQGKLIVEFAELAKLGSREMEEIKAWMSSSVDEIRKPFGRESDPFPRQFIFAGTTNEHAWMRDSTGGRRFWPVKCGLHFDIPGLKDDIEQLWAEAVHLYKNGARWWIEKNDPLWETAKFEQSIRFMGDVWAEPVLRLANQRKVIKIHELLKDMGLDTYKQTKRESDRVSSILESNGWVNKTYFDRELRKTTRGWHNPLLLPAPEQEQEDEIVFSGD